MKTNTDLIKVMSVQSHSYQTHRMQRYILKELAKLELGHTKDTYGNIYVTKGDADLYPTMVCHIDTVHDINNNVQVVEMDDVLLAIDTKTKKRYGIGGDDKVGIYITLQLLQKFDNFKAVFFLDEEVGCVGSGQADFRFFNDSTIVLECDRRGYKDFVTSIMGTKLSDDTLHDDIDSILTKYNRKKVTGGITDVGEIAENNDVQVANMSCGYYDPHSDNEYIIISEVEATKQMCYEILNATQHKRYTINKENRTVYGRGYSVYNTKYDWSYEPTYDKYNSKMDDLDSFKTDAVCPCCNANDVWYEDYEKEFFCMSCHNYVDINEEEISIDEYYMDNVSEEEYLKNDTILYDASFNREFVKDVEPKYIKDGNKI